MRFTHRATITLPLNPQLQWLLYAGTIGSFIAGDDRQAFVLPVSNPGASSPLKPAREYDPRIPPRHPCNLPIPASLYDEWANESWHGFRFLESAACDRLAETGGETAGDLLRTLVFGPDYGHYLLHPSSGLILSLRAGSMQLLQRSPEGFKLIDQSRTRGRSVLAFAAHPDETLLVYGDNSGDFYAHRFDATGFGKATKIAARQRKASRLDFVQAGQRLVIGGMGYLATYSYHLGKFAPSHEVAIPVRDFIWANDGALVLVNQGLHGIAAYRYDRDGFAKTGAVELQGAVQQMALSKCQGNLAVTTQESANISVYQVSPQ